jgi:hypothetical protein
MRLDRLDRPGARQARQGIEILGRGHQQARAHEPIDRTFLGDIDERRGSGTTHQQPTAVLGRYG